MRSARTILLLGSVLAWLGARPVLAHHSFAATYDSSRMEQVRGTVKELVWRNPHAFLRLDVEDKNGATQTWNIEWGSIADLSSSNLTRTTLRPGDLVIASGYPPRDPTSLRMLLRQLERPSDGWKWQGDEK